MSTIGVSMAASSVQAEAAWCSGPGPPYRGAHGLHVSDRPRSPMVTGRTAALSQSCRTCRNPSSPMGNFRAAAPSGRPVTPSPHHPSTCPAPSPRRHPAPPARIPQPTPPCFACSGPRSHRRRWSIVRLVHGFRLRCACSTPSRQLKPLAHKPLVVASAVRV